MSTATTHPFFLFFLFFEDHAVHPYFVELNHVDIRNFQYWMLSSKGQQFGRV